MNDKIGVILALAILAGNLITLYIVVKNGCHCDENGYDCKGKCEQE
jgi:hypothetical protein